MGDAKLRVEVDYGSTFWQFRYEVGVFYPPRSIRLSGLRYESILGVSNGDWNFLTQDNIDQSIALFKDIIVYLAKIPERLPAEYVQPTSSAT